MVPDVGQRVQAVIRALEEVILPAVDPAQGTAIDQARLAIVTLKLIAAQHDSSYHLALVELQQYARLAAKLLDATGNALEPELCAQLARAAADPLAQLRVPPFAALEERVRASRELADSVLASTAFDRDSALRERVAACILEHSAAEALLRRAWMAAPGTEEHPEALPSIAAIVVPAVDPSRVPSPRTRGER